MREKVTVVWQRLLAAWNRVPEKVKIGGLIAVVVLAGGLGASLVKINLTPKSKPSGVTQQIQQLAPQGYQKLQITQREAPFFTLSPERSTKSGIWPNNRFTLKMTSPTEVNFVKQHLTTSVPVDLQQISASEITMTLQHTLAASQDINITLDVKDQINRGHQFDRNYGWVFQAQPKFGIKTTLPGDKKTEVPVNTGIEIVFNQGDYKDPTSKIVISPKIDFRTENHDETLAIVPLSPLQPATVYTVTLKSGLDLTSRNEPISTDFSWSFQTEPIKPPQDTSEISIQDEQVQISPDEKAGMKVYTANWNYEQKVHTEVFKFNSAEEWLNTRKDEDTESNYWYHYYPENHPLDTSKFGKVMSADLAVQVAAGANEYDRVNYLQLPASLESGLYLVQFSRNQKTVGQVWMQSTYVAGYVTVGRDQTIVWANNLRDGKPINGAQVRVFGNQTSYSSSDDGVAVFPSANDLFNKGQHYVDVYQDEQNRVLLPITSLAGSTRPGEVKTSDYWTYFYNERRIYHPSDTVNFWGVVKGRNSGQPPASVEVSLVSGYGDATTAITKTTSVVAGDGSFIGKLDYTDLPEGWYSLMVKAGDVQVASGSISVEKFEKPEMKIEVTGDKKVIFAGDKVNFTGRVQFFDGTPVKNVDVGIANSEGQNERTVKTDSNGEAKYEFSTNYVGSDYPRYENVTVNPKTAGMGQIEGEGAVFVFGSHLLLNGEGKQNGSQANVRAKVNKVDLKRFVAGSREEELGDPAGGMEVKMEITKTWWERVENGTYYDFIEKTTRPSYSYNQKRETLTGKDLTTNGSGEAAYDFEMEKDRSYEVNLTVTDSDGRAEKLREYFYNYGWSGYQPVQEESPMLDMGKTDNQYSVGEPVSVGIKQAGKDYQGSPLAKYLFLVVMRGKIDFYTTNEAKIEIPFLTKHIPNAYISGVIFTGKNYTIVGSPCNGGWSCEYSQYGNYFDAVSIRYRQEDSRLAMSISADKEKYLPGDTAVLTAMVTKGGTPKAGVTVNAVLVDEALRAIGGVIEPSPLESLYRSVESMMYYTYYSHKPVTRSGPMAEKGGGGGGREIFKDTAYFGEAVTDGDGKAQLNIKLPDNLTTWIVFAQGINSDLEAGQSESKLVVSKDFFVTSNFPKELLGQDKPKLAANSFGRALGTETVNYTARITQSEQEISKTETWGPANKQIAINMPTLKTGEYKAELSGKTGLFTDGVIYPFKVVDSHINFLTGKKWTLAAGQQMANPNLGEYNQDQMMQVQVSDKGRGEYYWTLKNYCWIVSNRIEKVLAKIKASNDLIDLLGDKGCQENGTINIGDWQYRDGGLAQVKWGGSDLTTTVWAIYSGATGYDKEQMVNYLESKTGAQTAKERIYAWWGLEMLGKSQVAQLQAAGETATGFEEKSLAALALLSAGDKQRATDLYWDILADYAYTNKPYVRIQRDQSDGATSLDKQLLDTATVLLLGSKVGQQYNEGMDGYLRDYVIEIQDVVIDLAKIGFVETELGKLPPEKTNVTVNIGGVEKADAMANWCNCYFTEITPDQLAGMKIKVNSGKAEVELSFYGNAKTMAQMEKDKRLKISRRYEKAFGSGPIVTGDIVKITLDVNVDQNSGPIGGYKVNDYLPAGFTYLNNPETFGLSGGNWWLTENNGQVSGYYYNSRWWNDLHNNTIWYYARAAAVGTYTAEPAFIQYLADPSIFMSTGSDSVTIEL